jgi:hypothetical protein
MARIARACPEHERAGIWQEALAAASGLETDDSRVTALRSMAAYLDADALEGFVEAARSVTWLFDRAELLQLAAASLRPDQRTALLREALRTVDSAESDHDTALVIERLAPQLPDEILDESLDYAERIEETSWLRQALAALAPYLDASQLRRALADARAISDGADATRAIVAVAVLDSGAPRDVWERARSLAVAVRQPTGRAAALAQVARVAQEPERTGLFGDALAAARAIASPYARADALIDLAGEDGDAVLAEALEAIKRQDVGANLYDPLRRLAPMLPPAWLHEALRFARGLRATPRAHALASLVPFLPAELQAVACEEALASGSAGFQNDGDTYQLILSLAPHLSAQVARLAINLAMGIDDAIWRPQAVAALAEHLSEAEYRELLGESEVLARHRRELHAELKTRVEHSSQLIKVERDALLDEVLAEDEERQVPLLVPLIPYLAGAARTRAVDHALAAARSLGNDSDRARSLTTLAAVLPDERALMVAEEALAAATASTPGTRWKALLAVVPALRSADRERALTEAIDDALASVHDGVGAGAQLEESLGRLSLAVSTLPPGIRGALVLRVVRELERFARADLLRAIAAFMPAFVTTGTPPSVCGVIAEVESWWP